MRPLPFALLRRHFIRHCWTAAVLTLWLCSIEGPTACVVLAWPQFLSLSRGITATDASGKLGKLDRTAVQHSPIPFPGTAERATQARALWEEVEAKGRLSPCWKRSLLLLHAKCAEVQKDDTIRSRLALFMATCDADSDGRAHPSFHCGTTATAPSILSADGVRACVRSLADTSYAAFLQYRLHADVLCAYLQEELYQERTEAAVAAMLREVETSAATLNALQQSGGEMLSVVQGTQALQREAQATTAALQQQLGVLHEGHTAALQGLRAATEDILQASIRTDAVLGQLHTHVQETAAEALNAVQTLREQSVQQFAAMEEQTRGVLQMMEQLDYVQRMLAQQSVSWHRVLGAVGCVVAAWVATCVPRTAAARLPALALTLFGTAGLPVLQWWTGQEAWLLLCRGTWQILCAAGTVGVVGWAAYAYDPPDVWQRRVVREEVARVWRELHGGAPSASLATAASVLQPYVPRKRPPVLQPSCWGASLPQPLPTLKAAQHSPSPTPAAPLSIAVSPLHSDDDDRGRDESASAQSAQSSVAPRRTPPPPRDQQQPASSLLSVETSAKTARKRDRASASVSSDNDDRGTSPPRAKLQRAETAAPPKKVSPPGSRGGGRRGGNRTSKKG